MAERKSGPVRPPVIDLTARPADPPGPPDDAGTPAAGGATEPEPPKTARAKPEPRARASAAEAPGAKSEPEQATMSPPPPPTGRRPVTWGPAAVGGVGGAIVAVALCYGLATAGYWPSVPDSRISDLLQRLTQAEQASTTNGTALADLDARFRTLQADFAAKLAATATSLGQLQQTLAKQPAADLGALQGQLKTLSARVDAVAAGASSADAGALAANLATVQQQVGALAGKIAAVDAHLTHTDSDLGGLRSELAGAKAAIDQAAAAPSSKSIAAAVQMPLLISALESDVAAGRPYADDLQRLTAAAPETRVPAAIADAAAHGLPDPDDFTRRFEAKMPDLLAALPGSTDSSWQTRAGDWLRGVLAIRPVGEQSGDTPGAILSRLETAVLRHDFATAATLFSQLPQPVRDAAGPLAAELVGLAAADSFVSDLRKAALTPIGTGS